MNKVNIPILDKFNSRCIKISFLDKSEFFIYMNKNDNRGATFITTASYDKDFKHTSTNIVENLFFFNKSHHDNMALEDLKNQL